MKSPPASNTPPSSRFPTKPSIARLNDYRPVALTSVVMKSFERLVLSHLKVITGPLLDPLQFAYRANRSVDDAVNMGLHYILQQLDSPGTYSGENKYLNPCRFRKFGHLQRNVSSIIVMVGVF